MRKILNILGITLLIGLAGFAYYKNLQKVNAPKIEYEKTFHIAYTVLRGAPGIVDLGPCNSVVSTFKLQGDSAVLQFAGKSRLIYKILGVDTENGLHLLAGDSTQILVYKIYDPRYKDNIDSTGVQMKFQKGEILLFPSHKCF